jgi:hypothetical protein
VTCAVVICKVYKAARLLELQWLRHGGQFGNRRMGNIHHWKSLLSSSNEDVNLDALFMYITGKCDL